MTEFESPPDAEVEELWSIEADRRWQEIESGTAQTIPWERSARDCFAAIDARCCDDQEGDGSRGRAEISVSSAPPC
jgi:hypothetical protein